MVFHMTMPDELENSLKFYYFIGKEYYNECKSKYTAEIHVQ